MSEVKITGISIRKAVSQPLPQENRLCPRRNWHLR